MSGPYILHCQYCGGTVVAREKKMYCLKCGAACADLKDIPRGKIRKQDSDAKAKVTK